MTKTSQFPQASQVDFISNFYDSYLNRLTLLYIVSILLSNLVYNIAKLCEHFAIQQLTLNPFILLAIGQSCTQASKKIHTSQQFFLL